MSVYTQTWIAAEQMEDDLRQREIAEKRARYDPTPRRVDRWMVLPWNSPPLNYYRFDERARHAPFAYHAWLIPVRRDSRDWGEAVHNARCLKRHHMRWWWKCKHNNKLDLLWLVAEKRRERERREESDGSANL